MPSEIRWPFPDIPTAIPGFPMGKHLPKQAAMLDRLTLVWSADWRDRNHEPNKVTQRGLRAATPSANPQGHPDPATGSVVARFLHPHRPGMPPSVVLNLKSKSHIPWAGWLGGQHAPFRADQAGDLLALPYGGTWDGQRSARRPSGPIRPGGLHAREAWARNAGWPWLDLGLERAAVVLGP